MIFNEHETMDQHRVNCSEVGLFSVLSYDADMMKSISACLGCWCTRKCCTQRFHNNCDEYVLRTRTERFFPCNIIESYSTYSIKSSHVLHLPNLFCFSTLKSGHNLPVDHLLRVQRREHFEGGWLGVGRHGIFPIPVGIGWHRFKRLKADDVNPLACVWDALESRVQRTTWWKK